MLNRFASYCTGKNIHLYFTWETSVRHPGYFGEKDDAYKNSLLSFFKERNIIVLDEYDEHLYPESFYSDMFNHLNEAGRRIRTEKLIQSIQNITAPEKYERCRDLYLINVENHETVFFDRIKEIDFDYRIYTTEETTDDETINNDGIQTLLNSGRSVYFNDIALKNIPAFQNTYVVPVETIFRSLQDIFCRYPNNLFFLVQSGRDLPWQNDAFKKIAPLKDFFAEDGHRVAVIGTGRLSGVKRIIIKKQAIALKLKKGETIGSFRLPFDIRLESRKISQYGQESGRIQIGRARFFVPSNKPGIWCVVYDPDLEVVIDRFFYEHPGENIEARLFCVKKERNSYYLEEYNRKF